MEEKRWCNVQKSQIVATDRSTEDIETTVPWLLPLTEENFRLNGIRRLLLAGYFLEKLAFKMTDKAQSCGEYVG